MERSYARPRWISPRQIPSRSEEHTSELQSLTNLVCRLLLEKKSTGQGELAPSTVPRRDYLLVPSPVVAGWASPSQGRIMPGDVPSSLLAEWVLFFLKNGRPPEPTPFPLPPAFRT